MSDRGGPIRWLFRLGHRRPRPDEAADWEVEHHLAELADRLVEAGWDPEEARREAERRFGDARRYRSRMKRIERGRMAMKRGAVWGEFLLDGIAGAARTARRYPGFTLAVVLTLGLGIGANAAMFGIVDRLLLRPPAHVVEPDEVRRVVIRRPDSRSGELGWGATMTFPDFQDFQAHEGFEGVAAYGFPGERTVGSGGEATRVRTVVVSHDFFPLLGVEPALGRVFTPEEDRVGADPTVVLSHEYWERALGADPDVLGRTLEVGGTSFTVIGVAPPGFTGVDLGRVDLWLPMETTQAIQTDGTYWRESRNWWWIRSVARLKEGVGLSAAEEQATALHRNGRRELIEEERYPEEARIALTPLIAAQGPNPSAETRVARWLTGVSLIVLLIACANVANLLLARGARRRREVAVRLALGVSRKRLVGQMLVETVLLALGGAVAAVILARWGGGFIRDALLPGVFFPDGAVNGRVVLVALGLALLAGLAAGLGPALRSSRTDLSEELSEGRRGSSGRRSRTRDLLTVAQAAMSVVLLVGAGLFIRSLHELRSLDLGLDMERVVLAQLEFGGELENREKNDLYLRAAERVASQPAVEAVAATAVPFRMGLGMDVRPPGVDSIPRLPGGGPFFYPVTPGYFRTVGLRIEEGRGFEPTDDEGGQRVVVVSRTMADTLWPGRDAVGECLLVGPGAEECTTVVGVAEDAARSGFQDEPYMAYYLPLAQGWQGRTYPANGLYIRPRPGTDPETLAAAVAPVLRSFSPQIRYASAESLWQILEPQARSWTLGAAMFTAFGLLALVVAAIGLYSVLAFDVARRTREIGIRNALGAEKRRLLRDVVLEGTRLAVLGVALGLLVAYVAAPFAEELLFQVEPRDPEVLGAVAGVLVAVAVAASLVPGFRATRVDPMVALRTE